MIRFVMRVLLLGAMLLVANQTLGQDSQAATTTLKKLQQKETMNSKDDGFKNFIDDINLELDKTIRFKVDNSNGLSNNMKVSFSCKDVTVEKVLNELADKYDFGY